MKQYLEIVKDVLENGTIKHSRTGIETISSFSHLFKHDLANGFPLLTTKKMDGPLWNSIVHELLWFLSGESHIRNLEKHTRIWDAWADEEGELETAYGFYWRKFPFSYAFNGNMKWTYNSNAHGYFDQVSHIIHQLKTQPNSRRMVCSAWEPKNASQSKLPPCHFAWIASVHDGRLCLHWVMRSVDLFLGFPFNIASYSLLCHILAQETDLQPGIVSCSLVDAHIYYACKNDKSVIKVGDKSIPRSEFDHTEQIKIQLTRKPLPLPRITISRKPIYQLAFDDIQLHEYQSHGKLSGRVAV